MAGLGRKVFTAGQVLAAADVQGYLQDQSVQVYASSTARSTVVGTAVSEGMVSYLKASSASVDTANQIDFYNGSDWESIYTPGRNAVINGAMEIWQRGLSGLATATSATTGYTADRWQLFRSGYVAGATCYRPAGPTGFQYAARVQRNSGNTSTAQIYFSQTIETINSVPLVGDKVTFSFWARAGADYSSALNVLNPYVTSGTGTDQNNSSGFTGASTVAGQALTLTTSWQKFSVTGSVSSAATQLAVTFSYTPVGTASTNDYFEVTGVQLEAGSVATPFRRAGGTIAGELAACQRYYVRFNSVDPQSVPVYGIGFVTSGGASLSGVVALPVAMRIVPTLVEANTLYCTDGISTPIALSSPVISVSGSTTTCVQVLANGSGLSTYRPYLFRSQSTGYLGLGAEL